MPRGTHERVLHPCTHERCAPLPGRHVGVLDARVWTVEVGAGRPLVFVHGVPATSYLWRNVQRALAPRHRTLAIDLPPLGASCALDGDHGLEHQADRLAAWADALGLERFTLIGHDVGGGVAHHFAARHRDRLDRLVLVDVVAFAEHWPVPVLRMLRVPLVRAFVPEAVETAVEHYAADAPPAFVVWGDSDRFQPLAAGERLHHTLPGSTLQVLLAGHFLPEEAPDRLAAAIARFVPD